MKAIHIMLILFLVVAAPAAYVLFHSEAPPPQPEPEMLVPEEIIVPPVAPLTNVSVATLLQEPVQPLDERADAMLFEIDALQGMPFDQSIIMPFD